MTSEIVSCTVLRDIPYLMAVATDGRIFIGRMVYGRQFFEAGAEDVHEIVWHRATDIPLHTPSTP